RDAYRDSYAVGTVLEGQAVTITADRDISMAGATVLAEGDVRLDAGNDIQIVSAQDTLHEEHSVTPRKSRIGGSRSGGVLSVGSTKTRSSEQDSTDSTYQVASTVASRSGSVTVEAGKTLTVGGSDLAAGQ